MKHLIKLILTISLITFSNQIIFAQAEKEANIKHTLFIGYPASFFDNPEIGIHLGYNPSIDFTKRFSIEGQVSYSGGKFEEDDDNFAHNGGHIQSINVLGGARFFLIKKETQFYLNLLAGYAYLNDKEIRRDGNFSSESVTHRYSFGYSAGLYVKTKRNLSFGTALESNEILTIKLGYQF